MKAGNLLIIWVLTIGHVLDKGVRYKREEVIYLLKWLFAHGGLVLLVVTNILFVAVTMMILIDIVNSP